MHAWLSQRLAWAASDLTAETFARALLSIDRFRDDLQRHVHANRIDQDVESADLSGVSGTPTFFINGQRHYGAYDADSLTRAVKIARARANIA